MKFNGKHSTHTLRPAAQRSSWKHDALLAGVAVAGSLAVALLGRRTFQSRELSHLRDLYTALFERSEDCIYTLDFNGRFIDANPAVLQLIGYDRTELSKVKLSDIVPADQMPQVHERMEEIRTTGRTRSTMQFRLRRKDGQQVIVESRAALLARDGKPYAVQGIARDITQRYRDQQMLRESEEKFRNLAETMHAAVGIVQGTRFVYANRYMGQMLGYSVEEILQTDFPMLVDPVDRPRMVEYAVRRQRGEDVPSNYVFIALTKSGERRWVDFSVSSLVYQGRPAIVGTGFDLTDHKRIEEAMQQAQDDLRTHARGVRLLADTATRLLATKHPRETLHVIFAELIDYLRVGVYWNYLLDEGGTKLRLHTHRGLDELTARRLETADFGQLYCGWAAQQQQPVVLSCASQSSEEAAQLLREVGISVYVCYPMVVEGRTIGTVTIADRQRESFSEQELEIVRAIAHQAAMALEHQRLAAELESRAADLAEANAAKDHFMAVLSHELRTPLTPALAAASVLECDEGIPFHAREDMKIIRRNVELEARLIDDLLDVTRIVRGKIELNKKPVDLSSAIRQAIEVCRGDIEARDLHLYWDDPPDASYWLQADGDRLQQIFWNLLKNSIKFTPRGGCIGIRSWGIDDHAVVEVFDSGEGISSEALGRIFKPFEQAERSITRQFGGLGLGLAITRALVELHGGTISASSVGKGHGATFRVELPLATAEQIKRERLRDRLESQIARSFAPTARRILLVEDHGDTAKMLVRLLRQAGYQVQHAADVGTARQLASENAATGTPFDMVISDLGLPDGSGHELMRELRAHDLRMTGIALSGYGMASDMEQSRAAGFAEHVTKPVNFSVLQGAIARALGSASR